MRDLSLQIQTAKHRIQYDFCLKVYVNDKIQNKNQEHTKINPQTKNKQGERQTNEKSNNAINTFNRYNTCNLNHKTNKTALDLHVYCF